ncbi:MAG TPA: hypothetical protein PLD47_17375 [Aggregatilineales bacterium]|nr:hypothetical protein [Anaerolineales bacterium]HRE49500.1 hypothetical protein [Aggregatilineales bacterium]
MTDKPQKPIFIYNTAGDWIGTLLGTYIFDPRGESIGFVQEEGKDKAVYTFDGEWVGLISKDGRILRKRANAKRPLHAAPLPKLKGKQAGLPARAPLPPQNAEIGYDTLDVLEEDPEVFKRVSDRRADIGENAPTQPKPTTPPPPKKP